MTRGELIQKIFRASVRMELCGGDDASRARYAYVHPSDWGDAPAGLVAGPIGCVEVRLCDCVPVGNVWVTAEPLRES